MKLINLKLVAKEPIIVTEGGTSGQSHECLDYIPGNMILGACAYAWKRINKVNKGDDKPEFRDLFLSNKVLWGHATPSVEDLITFPIPLSYQVIKNYDGLPLFNFNVLKNGNDDKNDNNYNNKKDNSRVLNFADVEFKNNEEKLKGFIQSHKSGWIGKDEPVKLKRHEEGFMEPNSKYQVEIIKSVNTHVNIAQDRVAADGNLFAYSAISRDTTFISQIYVDESLYEALKNLLDKVPSIHVGASRSAGYGKLSLEIINDVKNLPEEKNIDIAKGEAFIYLKSGYISKYIGRTPLESFEQELIGYFDGLEPGDLKINDKKCFCLYKTLSAFNNTWQLPRRSVTMIREGSVIGITFSKEKIKNLKTLPKAFGGRINEGYGAFLIDPNFVKDSNSSNENIQVVETQLQKEIDPNTEVKGFITSDITKLHLENGKNSLNKEFNENKNEPISSLLKLIRMRVINRRATELAREFTSYKLIKTFLKSQTTNKKISTSQLGRIRAMITTLPSEDWKRQFELLSKNTMNKWESSIGDCPFNERKELLSDIMKKFLDKEYFFGKKNEREGLMQKILKEKGFFEDEIQKLPGGKITLQEEEIFNEIYWKNALMNLIKAWVMASRTVSDHKEEK